MKKCEYCGVDFQPNTFWQKYCTNAATRCRWKAWNKRNPRVNKDALKEANKGFQKDKG